MSLLRSVVQQGVSEKRSGNAITVRRHMELAGLPSEIRKAVETGASAKRILEANAASPGRNALRRELLKTERQALSVINLPRSLEFCQGEGKPERTPILIAEFPQFLTLVKSYLPCVDNVNRSAAKLGKKFGVRKLFKQTRPTQKANVLWIEYQAEWLADAIIVMAPEAPIRNGALAKVKGRAGELEPKKTPRQIYDSKIGRLQEISKGPPPRPMFRRNGPHLWERLGPKIRH